MTTTKITFGQLISNIEIRIEFINSLTKEDRIKVIGLFEQFNYLQNERRKIFGKTYGNRKMQAAENLLAEQSKNIRIKVEEIILK